MPFTSQDLAMIEKVVAYLNGEFGAVSANVELPSGRLVCIHRDGKIVDGHEVY